MEIGTAVAVTSMAAVAASSMAAVAASSMTAVAAISGNRRLNKILVETHAMRSHSGRIGIGIGANGATVVGLSQQAAQWRSRMTPPPQWLRPARVK